MATIITQFKYVFFKINEQRDRALIIMQLQDSISDENFLHIRNAYSSR